jgi:pheophorbide a oxygenase
MTGGFFLCRLAPLSQGRIEPSDGTLQCSYHGWRFNGSGAAASIPQAAHDGPQAERTSLASKRSCVATYPVQVQPCQICLGCEPEKELF